MAHLSLNSYLHSVNNAIENYDSDETARLLSFRDPHVASQQLQNPRADSQCRRALGAPYDEVVAAHLKCCAAVANHDFSEAYNSQAVVVQSFLKALQAQKEENWALPMMFSIALDLRLFAVSADIQLVERNKGKSGDTLERAAEQLMGLFRVCASDNRAAIEDSKKWGMLNLVNQLFKIYFKINKLHLCKPLIRAIESLPIKDKFSLSQMVTFRFYVGRKAMFDSDYKSADEYLSFAFEKCHRLSTKNKRLILIYLIPVKMLLGQMPDLILLRKYELQQFSEVVKAVSSGNLLQLNAAMEHHEAFFIRCGIYLILEKLKIITYRNLFKKVYLIGDKNHLIDISLFTAALRMMQVDGIDEDETQCILANLIFENKIKGYISHQHKKLVVSKQNPFPQLSTVL